MLARPAADARSVESRAGGGPGTRRPAICGREVREVLAGADLGDLEQRAAAAVALDERLDHPEMDADDDIVRLPDSEALHLQRLARVLDTGEMDLIATNDILWDDIVSIESIGTRDVFDATVLGCPTSSPTVLLCTTAWNRTPTWSC